MKRCLVFILAFMLWCCGTCSLAEEVQHNSDTEELQERFDVQLLANYAVAEGTPAYDAVSFGTEDFSHIVDWTYATDDSAMEYVLNDSSSVQGEIDVTLGLMGSSDEYGIPILVLEGTLDQKLTPVLVQVLVGERLYWISCKKAKDAVTVQKNDEGGYDFAMALTLGTAGIELIKDLYASEFGFSIRVYDAKKLCFSLTQAADEKVAESYRLFYKGLLLSRFLDEQGDVQGSCQRVLSELDNTNDKAIPKITIYPKHEKLWLPDDKTTVPKVQKSVKPIEIEERFLGTMAEFTNIGDWGRSKGVPWVKMELRNTDPKRAIQSVTFCYYCTTKSGEMIPNANTGEKYGQMTIEKDIKPKKKAMLPKYSFTDYGSDAKILHIAIREAVYKDGSIETVPDRDLFFTEWSVK